jgi:integron integrase
MPKPAPPKTPLRAQVKNCLRVRHYSIRTEEAYVQFIRRFILYHGKRHPAEMGADEIRQYLSHLAADKKVAASTQNVALSALLFLYHEVLGRDDITYIEGIKRAKQPKRVPTVLTREEVRGLLSQLSGTYRLMAGLLYGAGVRLMECVRLRVKDIDFGYMQVTVRDGKGGKDRRAPLPESLTEPLRRQLERVRLLHVEDMGRGYGRVCLPYALERKYPNAARELGVAVGFSCW